MRGSFADEGVHGLRIGSHPLRGDSDTGLAHQRLSFFTLFGQNDSDDITGTSGSCGTAGTVEIGLVLGGRIDVDNKFHIIDVNPASRDIGGDQDKNITGGEFREVAVTCGLGQIAVQIN